MIKATITKENGNYISFKCEGHAEFARKGKDIVCAAISILTINACNSITEFTSSELEIYENDGFLEWHFINECDEKASLLMDSLVIGLELIEKDYKKILLIEKKEV